MTAGTKYMYMCQSLIGCMTSIWTSFAVKEK